MTNYMKSKEYAEETKRINNLFKSAPKGTGEAIEKANYFGGKKSIEENKEDLNAKRQKKRKKNT